MSSDAPRDAPTRPAEASESTEKILPPRSADLRSETDAAILSSLGPSTLDTPRRLVDLSTGLPSLTSLFCDLRPIVEDPGGTTVLYVHIPSSAIVEERFGYEALEAYRGLIATYLVGFSQDMRRERTGCILTRAYADDFVIVTQQKEHDERLPSSLADGITRHLSAIDEETASLLQVYVGLAQDKPFPKIHPERHLYRMIQQAQTQATDVGRQKLSAHVRILDRCISGERFRMLYQPIIGVSDTTIFAYEALVRCPEKELKSPHVLFNVAEQGDRIWALSRLLRRMAIIAVPGLPQGSSMFVNLHPQDFNDPELLADNELLARHASRLVFEVTERAAIHDFDHFRSKISALRDLGVRIAIDDLGSGYSALSLIAELDPDFIKFDMTLIRAIDKSPVRQNLIRNMISFASDLGAQVVGEGVETREEFETLRNLGCHLVQGFLFAVPSPPFIQTLGFTP
jgi:EAL domain-containing protein (putative c-di-GMP-specific phosphodiesterase class I)